VRVTVAALHAATPYRTYAVGASPGHPFLASIVVGLVVALVCTVLVMVTGDIQARQGLLQCQANAGLFAIVILKMFPFVNRGNLTF
jgi:hypothetical protein